MVRSETINREFALGNPKPHILEGEELVLVSELPFLGSKEVQKFSSNRDSFIPNLALELEGQTPSASGYGEGSEPLPLHFLSPIW